MQKKKTILILPNVRIKTKSEQREHDLRNIDLFLIQWKNKLMLLESWEINEYISKYILNYKILKIYFELFFLMQMNFFFYFRCLFGLVVAIMIVGTILDAGLRLRKSDKTKEDPQYISKKFNFLFPFVLYFNITKLELLTPEWTAIWYILWEWVILML